MNKSGYDSIDRVLSRGLNPLGPDSFEAVAKETDALILDVRHQDEFVKGYVPQSVFIGLDGGFAPWVGTLIGDVNQPLIIAPEEREEETITRLSRVGFDQTIGYLDGGFNSWKKSGKEYDMITQVDAENLEKLVEEENVMYLMFVKKMNTSQGHMETAQNTPLDCLNDYLGHYPKNRPFYIHCASGYRSVIAASILKKGDYQSD